MTDRKISELPTHNDLTGGFVSGLRPEATSPTGFVNVQYPGELFRGLEAFNIFDDVPDPTTVEAGVVVVVTNDPLVARNGTWAALGADAGQPATYWQKQG